MDIPVSPSMFHPHPVTFWCTSGTLATLLSVEYPAEDFDVHESGRSDVQGVLHTLFCIITGFEIEIVIFITTSRFTGTGNNLFWMELNDTVITIVVFHGTMCTPELDYPTNKIDKSDLQNQPNILWDTPKRQPPHLTTVSWFEIYEIRNSNKDSTLRCVWSNPNKVNPSKEKQDYRSSRTHGLKQTYWISANKALEHLWFGRTWLVVK